MRVRFDGRRSRVAVPALVAAPEPEPVVADVPPDPEPEEESAAERWDRLAAEFEKDIALDQAETAAAAGGDSRSAALAQAVQALVASSPLTQLASAHEKTLESVRALFAGAREEQRFEELEARSRRGDEFATRALGVLSEFAQRPVEAPHVHVTVPEQPAPDVRVNVAAPEVRVPDVQVTVEPPHVHVAAPPAPTFEVRPEIRVEAPPAPQVHVAPPNVHVTVEAAPRPGAVRAVKEDDGTTMFIVEDTEEDE